MDRSFVHSNMVGKSQGVEGADKVNLNLFVVNNIIIGGGLNILEK